MSGPYAHLALLQKLLDPDRLLIIFSASSEIPATLLEHKSYVMLGAVSPDYPNLAPQEGAGSHWADVMHCRRACEMIIAGIKLISGAKGAVRDKQLAWLLGYSAHLATDVTIHPVVEAKVGEYAENQLHHRICEMHQDSYVCQMMNLGEIGDSDNFGQIITECNAPSGRNCLDLDIANLWNGMLKEVYPELYIVQPPEISAWHREFIARFEECRTTGSYLFPLAGAIAAKTGLRYPASSAVDQQFIAGLTVPADQPFRLNYEDIFCHAADNVALMWRFITQHFEIEPSKMPKIGDWNLDTGRDEYNRLVYW